MVSGGLTDSRRYSRLRLRLRTRGRRSAYDPADTGLSPDPLVSTKNAGGLGVRWMANTGASELSSPVVAWNAALRKTLVYQGNEAGYLTAFDQATGKVVWSDNLGSAIRDTPLVEGGNVWISDTFNPSLLKLNAATGATECSTPMVSTNNGSATIGTPPGGVRTVYIGVNDLGTASGPIYAVKEANCATEWQFTAFKVIAGSWDPLNFSLDRTGRALVVLGTSDADDGVYAIDALHGEGGLDVSGPAAPEQRRHGRRRRVLVGARGQRDA